MNMISKTLVLCMDIKCSECVLELPFAMVTHPINEWCPLAVCMKMGWSMLQPGSQ